MPDSRPSNGTTRRRRECRREKCGYRFTTVEILSEDNPDGRERARQIELVARAAESLRDLLASTWGVRNHE